MLRGAKIFIILVITTVLLVFLYFYFQNQSFMKGSGVALIDTQASLITPVSNQEEKLVRLKPPKEVKALYATWGTVSRLTRVDSLIETMEKAGYNALVINVKDNDGRYMGDSMKRVLHKLMKAGIYPIARMVMFQDEYLASTRPELAIKKSSGEIWRDRGGSAWVDPTHPIVWAYNLELTKRAIDLGFSEINLDYVRFPSDGKVDEVTYPNYDGVTEKSAMMERFFRYFRDGAKQHEPAIVLSADIFGYTFLRDDGLGIGQRVPIVAQYFDVLSPMIYPSHYSPGNFGFDNPALEPYQVMLQTLKQGFVYLESVPHANPIIRPWIQDFDMGAVYNRERFQAQIQAIRDSGLSSGFMVWNPSNKYSIEKIREGGSTLTAEYGTQDVP